MKISDKQWGVLEPLFPKQRVKSGEEGGRPGYSTRDIFDGVLWVLRTGARWSDIPMPRNYPSSSTCYRHFRRWVEEGIFDKAIRVLIEDLRARGKIDLTETFIDATFVEAKKGALKLAIPAQVKGLRSWQSWTVDLFLSPCLLRVLHDLRVRSLTKQFGPVIVGTYLVDLSETKLTILINLGMNLDAKGLSSFLPISAIEESKLKMADLYDATDEDGWLSDSFLGFNPLEKQLPDMMLNLNSF